jgi:hypothetical protein
MSQIRSGAFAFDQLGLQDHYIGQGAVSIGSLAGGHLCNGFYYLHSTDHLAKYRIVLV